MLPWLLAAVTLAAVVLSAPALGRHLFEVFDDQPQPAWDRWLHPIELAVLRWIGDAGRSAESTGAYLVPLLISNALFGALALVLLLVQPAWRNTWARRMSPRVSVPASRDSSSGSLQLGCRRSTPWRGRSKARRR